MIPSAACPLSGIGKLFGCHLGQVGSVMSTMLAR
jgi:hypothetical protein